ncbi:hypothetical protein [Umezawaea sp. Da 62-37]|uniref:hypothetical protein n=1 Tax=Umezawaea sp. Da 62-37 TaxID=3075927 RepID=UPI0028F7162F|nr:hypothetical protein [Umezawaea sp. Da 62-37]WNV90996.1 hypothetical protein RM788_22775 [Umezawaea sp. Da 62-37]
MRIVQPADFHGRAPVACAPPRTTAARPRLPGTGGYRAVDPRRFRALLDTAGPARRGAARTRAEEYPRWTG